MITSLKQGQLFLFFLIIGINLYTFVLYFIDKRKAVKKKRRISEKQLLIPTYLFGGIGAAVAMSTFRHKTQTTTFKISRPLGVLITVSALYLIFLY